MEKINMNNQRNYFDVLPDYLVENMIFPYLTSKELFFFVRSVSSEWNEMMKNAWGGNIKDEMFSQIRNLNYIYEKDALAKTYEFKLQYLYNYRNLLIIYNANADIFVIIKSIIEDLAEEEVKKMVKIFMEIFGIADEINGLIDENKKEEIANKLSSEILVHKYREEINDILDVEKGEDDDTGNFIKEIQSNFALLNKETIESINDNCRLVYSFLQGVIEFRILKQNVLELKRKVDALFMRIQRETQEWPKRKKFFETAYKFLLFSKSSNKKIHSMLSILEKFKLKSPLMDFKEESYKLICNLRNLIEAKKLEIMNSTAIKSKTNNQIDTNNTIKQNEEASIDEIFVQNLLDRRLLLSKKLILLEKFYSLYINCVEEDNKEICNVKGVSIPLKNFLISMLIASQSKGDKFDEETILQIKTIIESKYSYQISQLFYTDEELEKKKEIITLKEQKKNLIQQKMQTEQILLILKKYLLLRENLANNKKKYKMILFLLSKIRKGETRELDEHAIDNMLSQVNLDEVDFDNEEISENEKNELMNFDSSDKLLKEIEESLTKQINSFVKEENEEDKNNDEHTDKGNNI